MFLQELLPWGRAPLEPFALGVGMVMRDAMRDAMRVAMRDAMRDALRDAMRDAMRDEFFHVFVLFFRKRAPFPFWVWGRSFGYGCSTRIILALAFGRGLSIVFVCFPASFLSCGLLPSF